MSDVIRQQRQRVVPVVGGPRGGQVRPRTLPARAPRVRAHHPRARAPRCLGPDPGPRRCLRAGFGTERAQLQPERFD